MLRYTRCITVMLRTAPKDEGMLIAPPEVELPDAPNLDSLPNSTPSLKGERNDDNRQTKLIFSVLALSVLIVGAITILGIGKMNATSKRDAAYLEKITTNLSPVVGETKVSNDNGVNWQTINASTELRPGAQVATGIESKATLRLGQNSSITLLPGTHIDVASLNSALVAFEQLSGTLEVNVAQSEPWTFEVRNAERSVSGKTKYTSVIGDTDWSLSVAEGNLRYSGREFSGSARIAADDALIQ